MSVSPTHRLSFDIRGMTCAACSARVEKVIARLPGVTAVAVNLPLETAVVEINGDGTAAAIVAAVDLAGYAAIPRDERAGRRAAARAAADLRAARERRGLTAELVVSVLLALPFWVEMAAMPLHLTFSFPAPFPASVQIILASLVQIGIGRRFYRGAWKALRGGGANMDVLVALGTTAAYLSGLAAALTPGMAAMTMHFDFDGSITVLTLVTFGKWLETRAKAGTTAAVKALARLQPETARRIGPTGETEVEIAALQPDDRILVRPGERIAADGEVIEGASEADESLITGESRPVAKAAGAHVVAGALNGDGRLVVRVTAAGEDTTLAKVGTLVEAALSGKAPVQRLVDRIAGVFVPAVLMLALLTLLGWGLATGEFRIAPAVAVLVIACPCALGLATPTALVAGIGAAARRGILVSDIETLERATGIDTVIFDKTGTLTEGRPTVTGLELGDGIAAGKVWPLVAALQAASNHPLAPALLAEADRHGATARPVERFKNHPGRGVSGEIDGRLVLAGSRRWLTEEGIAVSPGTTDDTEVLLASDGRFLTRITLADRIRPEAPTAIRELADRGLKLIVLSGDTMGTVRALAATLGIAEATGGLRPEDKADAVRRLKEAGHRVAMVGDGVNDAAALALADLGIAIGSGADVAIAAAGITLMRPDPRLVAASLDIATRTRDKIRQNLLFAFIYNLVGIPLAAFGVLPPAFAGAAMAASSVSVVANAWLLTGWRKKDDASSSHPL